MTHSHFLIAVLSFALGVLVTGIAYEYREQMLDPMSSVYIAPARPVSISPLVCEHLRTTGRTDRGCV